ncbi:hypothetical protein [Marinoscillum sp. MHG1-6]|uniref:hypothetical protein n=1 Tax=Marinoscillum sp. MHG1-6 TaxID=2959627 RepID=UPI002157DA5E|nr:hypothetical protein [Marinoscillum sp. MHG1-6]
MLRKVYFISLIAIICVTQAFAQEDESIHERVNKMHHLHKGRLKHRANEFLNSWNSSADLIKPAEHELKHKMKQNRHKGKDPKKGTEKLQRNYDRAVAADGTERSFLAETFALPMLHELDHNGDDLSGEDIYTAQYVIKFVLGVPRFNHGELDIENHPQIESELKALIEKYPDNAAHDQEIDGHIIKVFRDEADAFFTKFVAENRADYLNSNGGKSKSSSNLTGMNCGEKYEYLKKQGIMH